MENNLINLQKGDLDKNIYRIYQLDRFIDLLTNKTNVLVRTSLWEDPFENFILNSTGKLPSGQLFTISSRDKYFGQCWSLKKESDAMWRIYSQHIKDEKSGDLITGNIGVKVKSNIGKIFEPLFNSQKSAINPKNGLPYILNSFIGKVEYKRKNDLIGLLSQNVSNIIFDQSGKGQASTLMLKRLAFTHEREVRIVHSYDDCDESDKIYSYQIDPNHCFDEIVVDPRIPKQEYLKIKNLIRKAGYKNRIIQSGLYKIENFTFNSDYP
ncbi:hypothetical protein [Flavobacterium macacae]|uniref:DUF2971 domain-containing protein n=1 Tax=Flavobacterium macacae TaxID=2488993 RepID=A0A3P3W942_9FLAO|nr:hypothetical protein [Flavobacterium macacae]RRJ90516.1 hypothetical protein EG849_10825 [Flavobacterium macacae]